MLSVVVNLTASELKMFHLLNITKLVNTEYPSLCVGGAVIKMVTTENVFRHFRHPKKLKITKVTP